MGIWRGVLFVGVFALAAGCVLTTDLSGLSGASDPSDAAKPFDAAMEGAGPLDGAADSAADAGADAGKQAPPSCAGAGGAGADHACGATGTEDCCESLPVPGGTFNRGNDPAFPATVSAFRLDRYEVTNGRFAAFVAAGGGTSLKPPADGAGAHPKIAGTGWSSAYDALLSTSTTELAKRQDCNPTPRTLDAPVSCVDWYTAFAFCIWDGGRLPTEAEWNFAAAGGAQQRVYAWSVPATSTTIDPSYASYQCTRPDGGGACTDPVFSPVGTHSPKGDGRWGHADIAGNAIEWLTDFAGPYPVPCNDCANLTPGVPARRSDRDFGTADGTTGILSSARNDDPPALYHLLIGVRCARD